MKEKEFQGKFGNWIMENKPDHTQFYEFKVTNGGTYNLKQWRAKQPHQPRSLKQIRNDVGVYLKISDGSRGQKPIDAFFGINAVGLLVIWFNKYEEFFMIPIQYVPNTDSISYKYCTKKFKGKKLLKDTKKRIITSF